MNLDPEFMQLLEDILAADLLVNELRREKGGAAKVPDIDRQIGTVDALASRMRAQKSYFLNLMLAEITGSTVPSYDAGSVTRPAGEYIRRVAESRGYDLADMERTA